MCIAQCFLLQCVCVCTVLIGHVFYDGLTATQALQN